MIPNSCAIIIIEQTYLVSCFGLISICLSDCYDIVTIYLPILSTAALDFSRMSPLRGTNPSVGALS